MLSWFIGDSLFGYFLFHLSPRSFRQLVLVVRNVEQTYPGVDAGLGGLHEGVQLGVGRDFRFLHGNAACYDLGLVYHSML